MLPHTVKRVTQRRIRKTLGSPKGLSSGGHTERTQRIILDKKRPLGADGATRTGKRTTAYRKRATGVR